MYLASETSPLAEGEWSREMERPITNQSHWQTTDKKRQISLGTEEKEGEGWGGSNGERLHPTRLWHKHDLASPRTSPHPTPPGGMREQDRKGKDVGGGVGGLWTLTWSYTCQHGQRVMGERHACRPRMAGQSAEIEFPRLLKRTRRRESW